MPLIDNQVNLIWLGGPLRKTHRDRLLRWKELNPLHDVTLWIDVSLLDEKALGSIHKMGKENGIAVGDVVKELHPLMDFATLDLISALREGEPKNYGALSDLYRFYALKRLGGWYFDTDIEPLDSLPVDLELPLGFAVNAEDDGEVVTYMPPSILVTAKDSAWLAACLAIGEIFAKRMTHEIASYCNSKDSVKRMIATHMTTGSIALEACGLLRQKGTSMPFLTIRECGPASIVSDFFFRKGLMSYAGLTHCFDRTEEQSWLLDATGRVHRGLSNDYELVELLDSEELPGIPKAMEKLSKACQRLARRVKPITMPTVSKRSSDVGRLTERRVGFFPSSPSSSDPSCRPGSASGGGAMAPETDSITLGRRELSSDG